MSSTEASALRRFWIEFGPSAAVGDSGITRSRVYGVTANSVADALTMLQAVFSDQPLPPVARVIEDIDLAMLDAFHIGPSIVPLHRRGIWYPPGGMGP
jgi:hypothetical protein